MAAELELAKLVVNTMVANNKVVQSALEDIHDQLMMIGDVSEVEVDVKTEKSQEGLKSLNSLVEDLTEKLLGLAGINLDKIIKFFSVAGFVGSLALAAERFITINDNAIKLKNTMDALGAKPGSDEVVKRIGREMDDAFHRSRGTTAKEIASVMQQSAGKIKDPEGAAKIIALALAKERETGRPEGSIISTILHGMRAEGIGGRGEARGLMQLKMMFPELLKDVKTFSEAYPILMSDAASAPGLKAIDADAQTAGATFQDLWNKIVDLGKEFGKAIGPGVVRMLMAIVSGVTYVIEQINYWLNLLQQPGWNVFTSWMLHWAALLLLGRFLIGQIRNLSIGWMGALFGIAGAISELTGSMWPLIVAMTVWIGRQILALSLQGPKGWLQLAGAAAAAGVAMAAVSIEMYRQDEAGKKLGETHKKTAMEIAKNLKATPIEGGAGKTEFSSFEKFREEMLKASFAVGGTKEEDPVAIARDQLGEQKETNRILQDMTQPKVTGEATARIA